MIFSILHISDLHRDPANEMNNISLAESLMRDYERYTNQENIPAPSLIVVSGDLIQGVVPTVDDIDLEESENELQRQYDQADEFLSQLAACFFNGDRSRIVICPGNHDINIGRFNSSLNKIELADDDEQKRKAILSRFFKANTKLRWCWKDLSFYEINDMAQYNGRFGNYGDFINRFYEGSRSFDNNPDGQFDIYDYPNLNVTLVSFNSAYQNDLFNRKGKINPTCIAAASRELNTGHYRSRLKLAIWHHNTQGGPDKSDYMDPSVLKLLIDNGFSIGLHGHQHKPIFIDEKSQINEGSRIVVISAGTLCGSPGALPSGHPRSYNVIEIDSDNKSGKLHLRAMINEDFEYPIWNAYSIHPTSNTFFEFDFDFKIDESKLKTDMLVTLGECVDALQRDDYQFVIEKLVPIVDKTPQARPLLVNAYFGSSSWNEIIEICSPPKSIEEAVFLLQALDETGTKEQQIAFIRGDEITPFLDNPTIKSLAGQLARRF